MKLDQTLKIISWVTVFLALSFLWLSLRSQENQILYGILGLATYLMGFGVNKWIKNRDANEQ